MHAPFQWMRRNAPMVSVSNVPPKRGSNCQHDGFMHCNARLVSQSASSSLNFTIFPSSNGQRDPWDEKNLSRGHNFSPMLFHGLQHEDAKNRVDFALGLNSLEPAPSVFSS
ncbi:hypothetical protein AC1031_000926 [Aphanomyces cochlioides]|nr:hypothetical protein AC1031_000926 [Aphanomyces cochlioides]